MNNHFATTTEKMERVKYESYVYGFIAGVVGTLITIILTLI